MTRGEPRIAALRAAADDAGAAYVRAELDLGRALRAANRDQEGREHFRAALDVASRIAVPGLRAEAESELLVGMASLTQSQLRVARLAANGLTNQDIARELWVSVKTVETHLSATYRKLGISSRERLPAVLAPSGLSAAA